MNHVPLTHGKEDLLQIVSFYIYFQKSILHHIFSIRFGLSKRAFEQRFYSKDICSILDQQLSF
jgi:hypothetical protein